MDKVTPKCPYCPADKEHPDGVEMNLDRCHIAMIEIAGYTKFWYTCDVCGSESPRCNTPDGAYAAAMRRYQPENETLDKGRGV